MNKEFSVHVLSDEGKQKARQIAEAFDLLLDTLTTPLTPNDPTVLCPQGRELAIVRTKLEEACFFAKKAMCLAPNQINIDPTFRSPSETTTASSPGS